MMVVCPDCETLNLKQAPFCSNCGANLSGAEPVMESFASPVAGAIGCPKCGAFCDAEQLHCEECGTLLIANKLAAASSTHQPAALPVKCHVCATANEPHERFCVECGALLDRGSEKTPTLSEADPASLASTASHAFDGAPLLTSAALLQSPVPLPASASAAATDESSVTPASDHPGLPEKLPVPAPEEGGVTAPTREPSYDALRTRAIEEDTPVWLIIPETDVRFDLRGLAKVLIGRTDLAKDVLPEVDLTPHGGELGGVSRRHAIIAPRGEQWFVEDLDSMNGTWLNNRRLTPGAARPLGHGDRLRFGRVVMLFETA